MRPVLRRFQSFAWLALSLVLAACAASPGSESQGKASATARFDNLLVIGTAADYEARAQFERKLVSDLRASGTGATAHHVAAGGNEPIEREAVKELVMTNGYDAVLISRPLRRDTDAELKSGSSATKAVRKEGRPLDLFRYDYEELNEPPVWSVDLSVTISTELFSVEDEQQVWALETNVSNKDSVADLINEASQKIVRRLQRDGWIS